MKQVRALVASKKRDGSDVTRNGTLTVTTASCLTSSTNFTTAASGTGLLDCDADEVMINSVRIKGVTLLDTKIGTPADHYPARIRQLVVWFNKPLLVASAAGTLPPITEVLVTDSIDSLPVTDAANGGRFKILSNKLIQLGMNWGSTTVNTAQVVGPCLKSFDYTVKVGRMSRFKASSSPGTNAGGHYDSDIAFGQVDKGLLVLYQLVDTADQDLTCNQTTRVNYTG